jgi:hypothetical protein
MLGSAACWRGYGELLAVQYSDPQRMRFHQVIVDAYAVQHPGDEDPRAVQSVAIHLMTLALFLDRGVDPVHGTQLHKQMVTRPTFHRLQRTGPSPEPMLTFQHVPLSGDPDLARERAYEWARSAWTSWEPHQEVVHRWLATSGLS